MTVRSTLAHGRWSRSVLLALCVALVPLPALAADATPAPNPRTRPVTISSAPDFKAAVANAVDRDLAARPPSGVRRWAQSGQANADSPSFFKTKTGVLVLAVFAAGVGYAIYSTTNDRINSPGKQ